MICILDFDYTLCRTGELKQAMARAVERFGVTNQVFNETYAKTVSAIPGQYDYDVNRHAVWLAATTQAPVQEIVAALRGVLSDTNSYLYPDVEIFLRWLKEGNSKIIILTWGNPAWNREKIEHSLVAGYADQIICTAVGKESAPLPITANTGDSAFINDNPSEIEALTKRYPNAHHLRLVRSDGKYANVTAPAISPSLNSLAEVRAFLSSRI